jgi:tetratricopeptide (TPR) repeat protein
MRPGFFICAVVLAAFGVAGNAGAESREGALDGIAVLQTPMPSPIDYKAELDRAQALYANEKYQEAEPLADHLVSAYPFDGHTWLLDAKTKRHLGKYGAAIESYRRAIELLGPGVPGYARYWLAVCQAANGDENGALDSLNLVVFYDHYVSRPDLYDDENFKKLQNNPRFRQIAGRIDSSAWTRIQGWRHDIDYLVAELKRTDADYADNPLPEEFERLRRQLYTNVPHLSDSQIYVGLSKLLASLNQGHTNLWAAVPAEKLNYRFLPIKFYAFPEGVFVVDADAEHRALIGAQLVKIEDTPGMEALRRVGELTMADSGMEVLWFGPDNLALAQALVGLGIAKQTEHIAVTLQKPTGETVTETLTTVAPWAKPKLHASPARPAPLAFRDVDNPHWLTPVPDAAALYVQINSLADPSTQDFGTSLRQALKDPAIRNVVLDLRHNNGGNAAYTDELVRTLVAFSQYDGRKLYVIMGRNTYSATGIMLSELEHLADPVFVGEPTAMMGNNYGDEAEFRLPWSGITGAVASMKWAWGDPHDQRRTIVPQVPVELTAADYFAGRDPVAEAAFTLARQRGAADKGAARP